MMFMSGPKAGEKEQTMCIAGVVNPGRANRK